MEEHKALETLRTWNQKNRPGLSPRELEAICASAFRRKQPYQYGCHPKGRLRQFVQCVGRSNCSYYQAIGEGDTARQTGPPEEAPEVRR
jgi:hypothetical protein